MTQTEAREMARRLNESGKYDTVFVATTADSLKQNRHSNDGEWVVLETSRTTARVHTRYDIDVLAMTDEELREGDSRALREYRKAYRSFENGTMSEEVMKQFQSAWYRFNAEYVERFELRKSE